MRNRMISRVEKNVTEAVFRNKVWKDFSLALKSKQGLVLDFRNANFIASTVIPKLCCLGEIAKREGIVLEIVPSAQMASYLAELGFWRLADENGIFSFDKRYFDFYVRDKVNSALFCLEKDSLMNKYKDVFEFRPGVEDREKCKVFVCAELVGVNNTVDRGCYTYEQISNRQKAVLGTVSNFTGFSQYTSDDKMVGSIVELVHNSVWHSQGNCYFLTQTARHKEDETGENYRTAINISVADAGCGLYKSLLKKDGKDGSLKYFDPQQFARIVDKEKQNRYSIIEALFFREQDSTRGWYDIIYDLAHMPLDHFCELRIINGTVSFDIRQGITTYPDSGEPCKNDISIFLSNGSGMIAKKNDYFKEMRDIGFSFGVDIGITIPSKKKRMEYYHG